MAKLALAVCDPGEGPREAVRPLGRWWRCHPGQACFAKSLQARGPFAARFVDRGTQIVGVRALALSRLQSVQCVVGSSQHRQLTGSVQASRFGCPTRQRYEYARLE